MTTRASHDPVAHDVHVGDDRPAPTTAGIGPGPTRTATSRHVTGGAQH